MVAALAFVVVALGSAVLLPALMILFALNTAYPLTVLWGWFVVPFGAPALSVPQMLGVLTVVALTKGVKTGTNNKQRTTEDKVGDFVAVAIFPWVTLLCGWLIKAVLL